jgi:hypothetical protein
MKNEPCSLAKKAAPAEAGPPPIDFAARNAAYRAVGALLDTLRSARITILGMQGAARRKHEARVAELQQAFTEARKAFLQAFPIEQAIEAN